MDDRPTVRGKLSESQWLSVIIAAIVCLDGVWICALGLRVELDWRVAAGLALIAAINLVYATVRPDRRIAAAAASVLQLAAFTAASGVLSYLTVTSRFPLIDRHLAAADAAMGLNWVALFQWMQAHPITARILDLAYFSAMAQTGLLLVLLNAMGRLERVREFIWVFVLTLLIIIPVSWVAPAEGAWGYYGVSQQAHAYYLPAFYALRAGTMPEIAMAQLVGVIQFPSFHAALALILIYACRDIPYLFLLSLVLNLVMIASTPTSGGHHFVDILAGLVVVPLAILVFRFFSGRMPRPMAVTDMIPVTRK